MKRKRVLRKLTLCVLGIVLLVSLRFIALAEPQTGIGYALFKTSYSLSPDKTSVLKGYAANLIKYNGGYIPELVDAFLCSKLQHPASTDEFNAVVDFYVFKAGGREGRRIFSLPAPTRERITGNILSRLDNYEPEQAARALVLVEVIRRGEYLGKATLRSTRSDTPAYPQYEIWQQRALTEAKARFRKWWRTYATWQQKEKYNPLEDSGLEISGS
jgi:hypothetical protein